jgi:PAS domain S-box-containing protein
LGNWRSIFQSNQPAGVALRYGLAIGLSLLATAVAWLMNPIVGQSTEPLFFAAVMVAAWVGGLGPGLLATALSGYITGFYFFLNPVGSKGFGWDDALRLLIFLMVALLISYLTSVRKRAEMALHRVNEQLEDRIQQRTGELRRSNELLRQSEERFRLLVDGVADYALVMLDSSGRVVSWNPGAERIFSLQPEEAIGRDAAAFYTPEDVAKQKPAADLREALQQGRYEDEGWRIRRFGELFWANVITTALRDESNRPAGFAQVTRDITEMRSLEKELLEISDRQQMLIGHDLHDGIGQELTGIALLTQNLRQRLAAHNEAESIEAGRIAGLANRTLEQMRKLARGLAPVDLDPEGMETVLREMAMKVQASLGKPCTVTCRGIPHWSDHSVTLHLFRIAQEAVNNAVRHAKPKHIRIELDTMPSSVTLAVHDDGVGLPPAKGRRKGMGFSVMQYRSRLIGASLEIRSASGGTSVICTCPITQANDTNTPTRQEASIGARQDSVPRPAGGRSSDRPRGIDGADRA